MTCHKALAERLIEITSKPLQNYKKTIIVQGPCDPYYGISYYDYILHRYNWDISPNKRLVLVTKEEETLAPEDYDIESLKVIYHIGGFSFFHSSLNHKTFPVSVLNTIRQFAHDGIKTFRIKENAANATRDEIKAQADCQHALRQLS